MDGTREVFNQPTTWTGATLLDGNQPLRDAFVVEAALPRQHAPDFVFDAFCRSRRGGDWGQAFGTLEGHTAFDPLIVRAMPALAH